MQLKTFTQAQLQRIEIALGTKRLSRYLPPAQGNSDLAMRLYLWNLEISEAFQMPLHFAEIVCRNAIHSSLLHHLGATWYSDPKFQNANVIQGRFSDELQQAVAVEQSVHGANMTADHVVSALTFGFWEHLTTIRFQRLLWKRGIRHAFPGAYAENKTLSDINQLIQSVRRWRNRIAHHQAIFDKTPTAKYQDTIRLIKWVCVDTGRWVESGAAVSQVISQRPV